MKMVLMLIIFGMILTGGEGLSCKGRHETLLRSDYSLDELYFMETVYRREVVKYEAECEEFCRNDTKCFKVESYNSCSKVCTYLRMVIRVQWALTFTECQQPCLQQTDPLCQAIEFYHYTCYMMSEKTPVINLMMSEGTGYAEFGSV
ncbi:hypothetical protein LOTGIDRAFT_168362 [Lottia gigantea]|uniref:Apple domain-containing protein n=1 Tax=Lottia gigantea TaxID=225164 RepID=V3ZKT6_LOTGI|nr:hypothetical protein LOTGIDRAFT_168362 [Lottia gigantea]ESO84872.1 hypothetical protein LOTGIDRAFT_168362 [Lottia gigantea]